jgi:hypothetical protein
MWMDSYTQDTLIRDTIAEAHRRAAQRHLLRLASPPSASTHRPALMRRLAQALTMPRLKRLIERVASS